VFGGLRRSARPESTNLERLDTEVEFVPFELGEYETIRRTINRIEPDEIYNLAAQSFVRDSFDCPLYTTDVNGMGVVRILEAIRGKRIRLYQASTSEMFGNTNIPERGLHERSPFAPRSPYGFSKVLAHNACVNYRDSYGVPVSCGILFNHESPLRGREFVTQKIAHAAWRGVVSLGNTEARRDWGHAEDYVEAMWMMLQSRPDDYVIATGESHSIGEIIDIASDVTKTELRVERDLRNFRPSDIEELIGDSTKAREELGWNPKTTFREMIVEMVKAAYPLESSLDMTNAK
jgi:GDPmannose 4,6-dehydratase